MKIAGEATLQAPAKGVWDALLDPTVLVRTLPGCERLETVGENAYDMAVSVGVAAIRGTYTGSCRITHLQPYESLVLSAQGAGTPGTIGAEVVVRFADNGDGTTTLSYDADAAVGGMIGGVGQRMLTSVSSRMAGEFFGTLDKVLTGTLETEATPTAVASTEAPPAGAAPGALAARGVFTAPSRPSSDNARKDFFTGVAVGAGLVALGVALGAVVGGKR